MNKMQKKVVLGMSGGVDSTTAAILLLEQGYQVYGVTLRLQDESVEAAGSASRDIEDAREVCHKLGMEHVVADWRDRFREEVLGYFARSYNDGETPNPCVVCNRQIKFAALFAEMEERGADYVATGHYARVLYDDGMERWRLGQAADSCKDQSYVLYTLGQERLSKVLLPLGEYSKEQIREIAAGAGLAVSSKGDSQDICFIPDGDYGAFLERFHGERCREGDFLDGSGKVLGKHRGIWHYTIGQRKGLGMSFGQPMFVQSIHATTGNIVLGSNDSLFTSSLVAQELNWIDMDCLVTPLKVEAKIRYSHKAASATVTPMEEGCVRVDFDLPQRAATKGQAVVFYRDDFVVGGGIIC